MSSSDSSTSDSTFTHRQRRITTSAGVLIGVIGLALLAFGLELAHDWMVATSYRFSWFTAVLSYNQYTGLGTLLAVSGFGFAREVTKNDSATNSGLVAGFGGFLLVVLGLWMAFDDVFLTSHPASPITALLRYAEYTVPGIFLTTAGFELALRGPNTRGTVSKIIRISVTIVTVTALAIGVYLYPIVF